MSWNANDMTKRRTCFEMFTMNPTGEHNSHKDCKQYCQTLLLAGDTFLENASNVRALLFKKKNYYYFNMV